MNSTQYENAIKKHNEVIAMFREVQIAYRAGKCSATQFLAARELHKKACELFDLEFDAEIARQAK